MTQAKSNVIMRLADQLDRIDKASGQELEISEGGSHTKVKIGERQDVVPRHNEINAHTAKAILKKMEG